MTTFNTSFYFASGFSPKLAKHMTTCGEILNDIVADGRVNMDRVQVETISDCVTVIFLDTDANELHGRCVIINGEDVGWSTAASFEDCTSRHGFILGNVIAGHLQDVAAAKEVQAA